MNPFGVLLDVLCVALWIPCSLAAILGGLTWVILRWRNKGIGWLLAAGAVCIGVCSPRAATGIALTSTLPMGVTFRGASPGCAEAGGVVTCAAGDLRWGASEAITVAVQLDGAAPPGLLATTAQASAAEPDGDIGNNTVAVTVTVLMPRAWLPAVAR